MEVLLVCMPFGGIERPSLGISILKESLNENGIKCKCLYENFAFCEKIGIEEYFSIANSKSEWNIGEWIFRSSAHKDEGIDDGPYLNHLQNLGIDINKLIEIKNKAEIFIEEEAVKILRYNPKIVSCSSVFIQNNPSLAILRKIKELSPNVITLMGGPNCEGTMGKVLYENCKFLDFVLLGEGEETLPYVCNCVLKKEKIQPTAGILGPRDSEINYEISLKSARLMDLDTSPVPNFDEYFETINNSSIKAHIETNLLIETSRGCWWGEKVPCSFCSLNGNKNIFRNKSSKRVIDELKINSKKYNINRFEAVDNIISMDYFETVIPELIENGSPYSFLYEVKPNLSKTQIEMFAKSNIIWVQPGIESFHDKILKLLRKGTTSVINIQFIKWALEFGLYTIYNILYNIPLEEDIWVDEMNDMLPLLFHLQPPNDIELRFDRFGYYFLNQEKYSLDLEPIWTYKYVYPFSQENLNDFAFFLQNKTPRELSSGHRKTINIIKMWNDLFFGTNKNKFNNLERPVLYAYEKNEYIFIEDTRPCKCNNKYEFKEIKAFIYRYCDKGRSLEEIKLEVDKYNSKIEEHEIIKILDEFIFYKLMLKINVHYISLAVFHRGAKLPNKFNYMGRVKVKKSSDIHRVIFDDNNKSKEGEIDMNNSLAIKHEYIPKIKRFLELYCGDSDFRDELMKNEVSSRYCNMDSEKIEELRPLWDNSFVCDQNDMISNEVIEYRNFNNNKINWRNMVKKECESSNSRFAAWRKRQINRCQIEVGINVNDRLIHAPIMYELAKGCSVGCSFCALDAKAFEKAQPFTKENEMCWREMLNSVKKVIGEAAKWGTCYFATEPLDNPDYESFCLEFSKVFGVFPQTTTAIAAKNMERTKRLLKLSRENGGYIDRFSILNLKTLHKIFDNFTPEELSYVELILQNDESFSIKSISGRELKKLEESGYGNEDNVATTINCLTGFVVNIVDKTCMLISPCRASKKNPNGYKIHGKGYYTDSSSYEELLNKLISEKMYESVEELSVIKLRDGLTIDIEKDSFEILDNHDKLIFRNFIDKEYVKSLLTYINEGKYSAQRIAMLLFYSKGIEEKLTIDTLEYLFNYGILEEVIHE